MKKSFIIVCALFAALASADSVAGSRIYSVPVMFGGGGGGDACVSGAVRGLDPYGDGFLAVRTGPGAGSNFKRIDKIYNGTNVYLCDRKGKWYGIVYGGGRCGTMTPVYKRQEYSGPCKFGWAHSNWIELIAD